MIKVMFVCLGNICRSPMAEFILKDMVKKQGIDNKFIINSSATSFEEVENDMYVYAKEMLDKKGIKYSKREARKLTIDDYNKYDFIIGMDKYNISNIIEFTNNKEKISYKYVDDNFMQKNIASGNLLYDIDEGIIKRVDGKLQLRPINSFSKKDNTTNEPKSQKVILPVNSMNKKRKNTIKLPVSENAKKVNFNKII